MGILLFPEFAPLHYDLSEEQWSELLRELEEEKEEMMKLVLARFLKRKSNAIKKKQKPDNIDLSANEEAKAMFDFSRTERPIFLPYEFCAKEDDEHHDQQPTVGQGSESGEHEDDGASNHEDKEKVLESHQRTTQDIIQVTKSPSLSNTSAKSNSPKKEKHAGSMRSCSLRKQCWVPKSRGPAKISPVHGSGGSLSKKIWVPKSKNRNKDSVVQQLVSMLGETSSAKFVRQNTPKSSGGNNSKLGVLKTIQLGLPIPKIEKQPRHPLGLSNWQKRKLEKLSAQELKKRSMAWVPKRRIQFQGKDDANAEGVAKTKESKQTCGELLSQRFAPDLHRPYVSYIPSMTMSRKTIFGYVLLSIIFLFLSLDVISIFIL
uniref:Uncharacterized protein n=1 Tax=Leersia perrieri TaxID=77586 RepID=A0A0D9XCU2_9ORYZ